MYLAHDLVNGKRHYILRLSEAVEGLEALVSRDLFDLGPDPRSFIQPCGAYGFHLDPAITDRLQALGVVHDEQELEALFWPFLPSDVRDKLDIFLRRRSAMRLSPPDATERERIDRTVHLFDKRRQHYLRYGSLSQSRLFKAPPRLYRRLLDKSRDELEQYFMQEELVLEESEFRRYAYVIFDLQRFFDQTAARVLPEALDQLELDQLFEQELCKLADDPGFAGSLTETALRRYLGRYAVYFYDYAFSASSFLDDYLRQFMDSHRRFSFPDKMERVSDREASSIFGVSEEELKRMDRRELTRLYRQLAHAHHPDKGGEHDYFVRLTKAYQHLRRQKE